jgi:uncharacterized membrane protein (DUF485 family)
MSVPRRRSVFWIVSTHVVTTVFLMFALLFASSIAALILQNLVVVAAIIGLGAPLISLILTTNYSLGNIRRVATIDHPMSCFMPSMLAFCGLLLSLGGFDALYAFTRSQHGPSRCGQLLRLRRRDVHRLRVAHPPGPAKEASGG